MSSQNAVNTVEMSEFKSKMFAHIEIEEVLVKMQVDSGPSCKVLPRKFLPKDTVVDTTQVKLTTYSKASLKVLGVAKMQLRNPKIRRSTVFSLWSLMKITLHSLVLHQHRRWDLSPFSMKTSIHVNETAVKTGCQGQSMKEVTASYSGVFKGLGCMEGALHLEVDTTVAPAIMPPHRMPLTLKDRLKDELTRLEKASVIITEEEPTGWVSSIVVTEKPNGKLSMH